MDNLKIAFGLLTMISLLGCSKFETQTPSSSTEGVQSNPSPVATPKPTVSPTVTPTVSPTVTPTATPTVTPTPTPTVSPTVSPTVTPSPNPTMAAIVAGQTATSHEAVIPDIQYEWQRKPGIIMQSPSGADIPSWFEHSKPEWCYILNSWLQVFEAEGNTAKNTRVQYRNMKIYVLSQATRKWSLLKNDVSPYTDTWKYPFTFASSNGTRVESSGGLSFKPKYPLFAHGYGTHSTIVPQDIRAVFVSMDTRLVLENASGADDRNVAKYLVNVGADYWPNAQAVNTSWSYAPGVGQGRFILATPDWRKAVMVVPNGRYGSNMQEMIDNPPPLD
ncbi:hypothetical protein ACLVWU_06330 [Bdellovibrio sp. HCB290]|uniref:hypothetical protein n=1 Tax=Bdellovibrio sp. HCB290 TaxID=3394356 RepID=UPI0039B5265B